MQIAGLPATAKSPVVQNASGPIGNVWVMASGSHGHEAVIPKEPW